MKKGLLFAALLWVTMTALPTAGYAVSQDPLREPGLGMRAGDGGVKKDDPILNTLRDDLLAEEEAVRDGSKRIWNPAVEKDAQEETREADARRRVARPIGEVTEEALQDLLAAWKRIHPIAITMTVDPALSEGGPKVSIAYHAERGELTIVRSPSAKAEDVVAEIVLHTELPPYMQLPFQGDASGSVSDGGSKAEAFLRSPEYDKLTGTVRNLALRLKDGTYNEDTIGHLRAAIGSLETAAKAALEDPLLSVNLTWGFEKFHEEVDTAGRHFTEQATDELPSDASKILDGLAFLDGELSFLARTAARDGGAEKNPTQELVDLRAYLTRLEISLRKAEGEASAGEISALAADADATRRQIALLEAEIGDKGQDIVRDGGEREVKLAELKEREQQFKTSLKEAELTIGDPDVIAGLTADLDGVRTQIAALEAGGSEEPNAARNGGASVALLPEAEQSRASLIDALFDNGNPAAAMFRKGSILADAVSRPSTTIIAIPESVLGHPVTLAELEITISGFESAGRQNPFVIVANDKNKFPSLLRRRSVKIMKPGEFKPYREDLDLRPDGPSIITVGFKEDADLMGGLTITLPRPGENQAISMLGVTSHILANDPALRAIKGQLRDVAQNIRMIITPTPTYIDIVDRLRKA